jgi:diguanylate cyclase (GGDEF)-like protein
VDESHLQKQFDQHLLTLKLHEPNLKMHEEVGASRAKLYAEYAKNGPQRSDLYARLIDSDLTILEKYISVVDRLSREVWQVQGNTITAEFVRAMPHMLILTIIEARAGAIKHEIEMHNIRTRHGQDITPFLDHLRQTIEQMKGTVLNRYEAEARTLDHQIRQTQVSGDQNMESVWMAEVEVLERRLNDWADKSRPEFRRMVERKQQLQGELENLRRARAKAQTQPYNPAMPLDKDARRYADTLFTDKLEHSSREYQAEVKAITNNLSSRGLVASGMYYSELGRIGVEHVKTITHAKVDSLIEAFERAQLPLGEQAADEIMREATEWCERQGENVVKSVQEKARRAGMAGAGQEIAATTQRQISGVLGEIRRKLERKVLEAKFNGRGKAVAAAAEPDLKDDLLPIFPRRRLAPELGELVANANELAPVSLLMIDIDNFKTVNDRFQHHVGDEVLKGIASAIKSVCESKGRCYRYGGDEIVVLLPNHSLPEGRAVAERILSTVASVRFEGYPDRMTLSIGAASFPGSCEKDSELLRCADGAMYSAKEGGKNQVRVSDTAPVKVEKPR